MKGKKRMAGVAAGVLGVIGGCVPTAVETTQAITNEATVRQAQATQSEANQGQQKNVVRNHAKSMLQQKYATPSNVYGYANEPGMTPKQYGLYLAITGKKKYNDRRNKHYSKMHS